MQRQHTTGYHMYRVLAGNLSATFNLDGRHLNRYIERKDFIIKSLCEELILHDQILIPTNDYLTACGLILILGERNFLSLLESGKIRFLRLRGVFGYIRGTGKDGTIVGILDPDEKRPQDSPLEAAIDAGINVIAEQITEKDAIKKLLADYSWPIETADLITAVKKDAINDLKSTSLWRRKYTHTNEDLLLLPKMDKMQVRVLGPDTDVSRNIVDTLLALTLSNIEFYLAANNDCISTSTNLPIGDLINLKIARLTGIASKSRNIWSLFEINDLPDLGRIDLSNKKYFDSLLKLSERHNAQCFRQWFHGLSSLDEKEVFKEYIKLLHDLPWIQKLPSKIIRFAITAILGSVEPVSGTITSMLDTFVVDQVIRGKSPKYFIDDIRDFRKKIISKI